MNRGYDGEVQPLDEVEDVELAAHVEVVRRLVEYQEIRLLRNRARYQHALLLAAREAGIAAVRLPGHADVLQRVRDDAFVLGGVPVEKSLVRAASHRDYVVDAELE